MPGLDPRLSGLDSVPLDSHLAVILAGRRIGVEELVDTAAVHKVCPYESGKGERAFDQPMRGLSEAQQKERDQRDDDLDAHGVLGGAEEVVDLEVLLHPAKEQLDGPAPPVEIGDLLGA